MTDFQLWPVAHQHLPKWVPIHCSMALFPHESYVHVHHDPNHCPYPNRIHLNTPTTTTKKNPVPHLFNQNLKLNEYVFSFRMKKIPFLEESQSGLLGWIQKPSSSTFGCWSDWFGFGVWRIAFELAGNGVVCGVDSILCCVSSLSSLRFKKKKTKQMRITKKKSYNIFNWKEKKCVFKTYTTALLGSIVPLVPLIASSLADSFFFFIFLVLVLFRPLRSIAETFWLHID